MSLSLGSRLGPYEIVAPIGAGGMGEVYRARDTKLNREVALKVLPPAFSSDPQYMARLEREAQMLAALNHPNIAAIYGLEGEALVMELVEGATLAERITQGPVPLDEALQIAREIAEGLETAHEKGIIHRDLKPENIKITPAGTVKILDFGLAKAAEEPSAISGNRAMSPTLSLAMTQAGMILGTAAYMAPEQARGKPVDRRADIWSFGVVMWEILTGRRLFEAEDVSETLAAVLTRDVSLTSLAAGTPPRLRALLRDCLVRDPKQRLRDIGEARRTLDRIIAGMPDDAVAPMWFTRPATPARVVSRFVIPFGEGQERTLRFSQGLAISPDGKVLLVDQTADAKTSLMTFAFKDKSMAPFGAIVSTTLTSAVFSPDGRRVAYSMREVGAAISSVVNVQQFPATGSKVQISTNAEDGHHPVWSSDGKELYYTPGPGSRIVAVTMASQGFGFGPAPPVTRPFTNASPSFARTYDVARDGKRFLGLMSASAATTAAAAGASRPEIRVVLNWFDELKARAPLKK